MLSPVAGSGGEIHEGLCQEVEFACIGYDISLKNKGSNVAVFDEKASLIQPVRLAEQEAPMMCQNPRVPLSLPGQRATAVSADQFLM